MSMLSYHYNKCFSPANTDAEITGYYSIRMPLVVIILLFYRAVTSIATVSLKIILKSFQFFFILAIMADKNIVQSHKAIN